jgi:hypothetical protein
MFISSVKPTVNFKFIIGKKLDWEFSDAIHETKILSKWRLLFSDRLQKTTRTHSAVDFD